MDSGLRPSLPPCCLCVSSHQVEAAFMWLPFVGPTGLGISRWASFTDSLAFSMGLVFVCGLRLLIVLLSWACLV